MTTALLLSMAVFALAASISPGPVNIVALASGARHGFRASMAHVSGATIGFTALLLLAGFGLAEILTRWPVVLTVARLGGVAFLAWMAWALWSADGFLGNDGRDTAPSAISGAALQWLNPEAWAAALAGMSAYAAGEGTGQILLFAGLYFVICYISIAAWAYAGARLRGMLSDRSRMRLFNRIMAVLIASSAAYALFS